MMRKIIELSIIIELISKRGLVIKLYLSRKIGLSVKLN